MGDYQSIMHEVLADALAELELHKVNKPKKKKVKKGFTIKSYKGKVIKLPAGKSFKLIDGTVVMGETKDSVPSWATKNISSFKSVPYTEVINEFERQYNIEIETNNIDANQLFTGSFANNDEELALKSITLPLQLKYNKTNNTTIVLTKE